MPRHEISRTATLPTLLGRCGGAEAAWGAVAGTGSPPEPGYALFWSQNDTLFSARGVKILLIDPGLCWTTFFERPDFKTIV